MVDASDRLQRLRSPSTSVTVTASSGENHASLLSSPQFNLSAVDGSNGFVINGLDDTDSLSDFGDALGSWVGSAGDFNGDGFDDLIISAPGANRNGQIDVGASYVLFGQAGGFAPTFDLESLDGSNGFVIYNIPQGRVDSAGDINGDGYSDLIIGNPVGAGSSYVVLGKAEGFAATFDLSSLDGSNGFVINGINQGDGLGYSVSSAGDVNGDGFDDLLIGAITAQGNGQLNVGSAYLVFGKAEGFNATLNLEELDGSNGFVINGLYQVSGFGSTVSSAGDINGDGFKDLMIAAGATELNGQFNPSSAYIVFGSAQGFEPTLNPSQLNGNNGFVITGIGMGNSPENSVSCAGDVNGDGIDDVIVCGPSSVDPNSQNVTGSSYVVFGSAEGFEQTLDLSEFDGSKGFVINGIEIEDSSGYKVSGAGDVNGDGLDDLLIGVSQGYWGLGSGKSYLVFGSADGFGGALNLEDLDGSNGFVLYEFDDTSSKSGSPVSAAGDINGDGFDDLLIGSTQTNIYFVDAGKSYVVFGGDFTGDVTNSGTEGDDQLLGTTGSDIIIGNLGNDTLLGGGGSDVLKGGAGDDTLRVRNLSFQRLEGDSGTDTLRLTGRGLDLDLTTIANNKIAGIEQIDLTGRGNHRLTFNVLDVLALSDTTNQLIVRGNTGDSVTSTGQGWIFDGTTDLDGILYNHYTLEAATLLVSSQITQTIT